MQSVFSNCCFFASITLIHFALYSTEMRKPAFSLAAFRLDLFAHVNAVRAIAPTRCVALHQGDTSFRQQKERKQSPEESWVRLQKPSTTDESKWINSRKKLNDESRAAPLQAGDNAHVNNLGKCGWFTLLIFRRNSQTYTCGRRRPSFMPHWGNLQ